MPVPISSKDYLTTILPLPREQGHHEKSSWDIGRLPIPGPAYICHKQGNRNKGCRVPDELQRQPLLPRPLPPELPLAARAPAPRLPGGCFRDAGP